MEFERDDFIRRFYFADCPTINVTAISLWRDGKGIVESRVRRIIDDKVWGSKDLKIFKYLTELTEENIAFVEKGLDDIFDMMRREGCFVSIFDIQGDMEEFVTRMQEADFIHVKTFDLTSPEGKAAAEALRRTGMYDGNYED